MIDQKLIDAYNATSTDDGHGEIETTEAWLERQLISRIRTIEAKEIKIQSLTEQLKKANEIIYQLTKQHP